MSSTTCGPAGPAQVMEDCAEQGIACTAEAHLAWEKIHKPALRHRASGGDKRPSVALQPLRQRAESTQPHHHPAAAGERQPFYDELDRKSVDKSKNDSGAWSTLDEAWTPLSQLWKALLSSLKRLGSSVVGGAYCDVCRRRSSACARGIWSRIKHPRGQETFIRRCARRQTVHSP